MEHEAICVAYLPLPITRPVPTQASGSEPKAAAPVSLPGREQQNIIDADDIPALSPAKQHDMHIVAHGWDSPGHYSPGHSPSGLSRPHPADLQNYYTSNRGPADTTSTDAHSGSQMSPNPMYTAQNTQQLVGSQQNRIDPPTQEHISQELHEPQQPADPYTCTHHMCAQRFGDQLERQKHMREQHPNGDFILDLAAEELAHARSRKSAKSFACGQCSKRFTRAFTLREHSRAHAGARYFSCPVCDKQFIRAHDRTRHHKLHFEEKKFVCRGNLLNGSWGCRSRFARADALGRHFRSHQGQICIKPLLDEEKAERRKAWLQEQMQTQAGPDPVPAALSQRYPDLDTLDWNLL